MVKVSVILPNYNYGQYLNLRIDSILEQTYKDFELIILDDCSTDNSQEVIESYTDPRIQIHYNSVNSGNPFVQWKKGITLAKGAYIWIAEADDYCENNFLDTVISNIEFNNADIGYTDSKIIDQNGMEIGLWSTSKILKRNQLLFKEDFVRADIAFLQDLMVYQNVLPNASAIVFKKHSYLEAGGVDQDIPNCSDWLLWFKMVYHGKVTYIAQPLNYFRRHQESLIHKIKGKVQKEASFHEFFSLTMRQSLRKWLPKTIQTNTIHNINNEFIAKDLGNKASWLRKRGKPFIALKFYFLAYYLSSFNLSYLKRVFIR